MRVVIAPDCFGGTLTAAQAAEAIAEGWGRQRPDDDLVLLPMWMLSGAVFPPSGAPVWLRAVMRMNPVTYGVAAVRECLSPRGASPVDGLPGAGVCLAIVAGFGFVLFALSARSAARYEAVA